ncbi:MAG: putative thiamine biosynthesis protein [Chlamydiae bacterium]|nr:putative thiamine biosynthesis protein [Chlamydiota bacterium]
MHFILPSPLNILSTLFSHHNRLSVHALATLKEMGCGFFLALLVAFPLGWIMLSYKTSRLLLQPFFIVIQCLPMFTLAPIMVIWFGWSFTAIVIPTALMIFFPLTLNIYHGLRSTPQPLLDFFRAHRATAWQTFFKLRLPYATPHLFAGFRISAAIAGIGAVAGEWAGAETGLGILMLESRRSADLEVCFAALFCLTALSMALYGLVLCIEWVIIRSRRWKIPSLQRKKSSRKRRLAFALFLVGALFLGSVSCQEKSKETTRLLLDWLPNPNHVPLYVGLEKGFFSEEKISLKIQKMQDSCSGIPYLTSNQADLIITHLPSTFKAAGRGANLKIVGLLIKTPLSCLIYSKSLHVESPSDLSGTTLGYCVGSPDTSFIDYLLSEGRINPRTKRNVGVDLISAIGTGNVQCIFGGYWNIEPAQLRSLGVETDFFPLEELGVPPYYELIVLTKEESAYSHPDFIEPFQRALQKSLDWSKTHPEEAFAIYLRHNPDKRAKTATWENEAWHKTYPLLVEDQVVDPNILHNFYTWFTSNGFISNNFDYQRLIP